MNTIIDFFKRTPLSKFTYPVILVFGVLCIIIIFVFSTRFLTQEINRAFVINAAGDSFSIDLVHYKLVAHKLGLPESIAATSTPLSVVPPTPVVATSTPTPSVATTTPPLDKSAITLAVYNATSVAGLAGKTKDTLVVAGFVVTKTGNAKAQSQNSIVLKKSAEAYLPLLREALGTSFANATVTTAPADAPYDAIITVGVK